jgi:hypothetical protein
MGKIRKFIDRFILSDHEWKKKYCPHLYGAMFDGEFQKEFWKAVYDPENVAYRRKELEEHLIELYRSAGDTIPKELRGKG